MAETNSEDSYSESHSDEYSEGEVLSRSSSDDSSGHRARVKARRRRHRRSRKSPSPPLSHADIPALPLPAVPAQQPPAQGAKVVLCSQHGNDLVPSVCQICKHCTHMLKKKMVSQLVVDEGAPSSIPLAKERLLRQRSDRVEPTLTFSGEEMEVAQTLYSQGFFRKGHFDDLTKKHLCLLPEENKALMVNIETENLFKQF